MSGRFLVVGESGIDRYIYGTVNRLCPDAPAPILNPTHETNTAGMAGNVVANLISLGATHVDSLLSDPPIVKTRYVDNASGYILLRVDERDRVERELCFDTFCAMLEAGDYNGVVISSYNKGHLTQGLVAKIAEKCEEHGIPTFADHKWSLGPWSRRITVCKINAKEYAAQELERPELYCQNLVVTKGGEGSIWVNGDVHVAVQPVSVSDLSGAGDSFLSAFVIAYTENGGDINGAMEFANKAARVAVSKRGVVSVNRAEVDAS